MIRIGIVGFGYMGRVHFKHFSSSDDVEVVAICDPNADKFDFLNQIRGNISDSKLKIDLNKIKLYKDFDEMLALETLDAVSIALPTHLHSEFSIRALNLGIHVFCEKPIALNLKQGEDMIKAAEENKKILQVGHCIRFWPEYLKMREFVKSGVFGNVKVAKFIRLSPAPQWSYNNWLDDQSLSGGILVDLHIHDSDYINSLWGLPQSVKTSGLKIHQRNYDYIRTDYSYNESMMVTAEAAWCMPENFEFKMGFFIHFEHAVIQYDSAMNPSLKIFPDDKESYSPQIQIGDGYSNEILYFIRLLQGKDKPGMCTMRESLSSLELVFAERESLKNNTVNTIQNLQYSSDNYL